MTKKAVILQLRPRYHELRAARMYSDEDLKEILYAFAREIGCKWEEGRLRRFIESAFEDETE